MKPLRDRCYLDWNATTPLRPEARAAMSEAWDLIGNPSSIHSEGRAARQLVESARQALADAVGARPGDVIFTSGGTEANSLALDPLLAGAAGPVRRLIVSAIEHASVLSGGQFEASQITLAPATRDGLLDLDALRSLLGSGAPALVSLMLANNETGVIQPVAEAARVVHEAGGRLHVDAVQALGKIPIDISVLQADLLSVSAHKLGGPKGVGALVVHPDVRLHPLIRGGGQERSRRAGTENVAGIAGFGAAIQVSLSSQMQDALRMEALKERLETGLSAVPGTVIYGCDAPRLPNTTLATLPGARAETAVIVFDLDGLAVSSGSACSSGKVQPSHVLAAMGLKPEVAAGAIRISIGHATKDEDIIRCIETWRKLSDVLGKS